jgi:hypothetical protein
VLQTFARCRFCGSARQALNLPGQKHFAPATLAEIADGSNRLRFSPALFSREFPTLVCGESQKNVMRHQYFASVIVMPVASRFFKF